jgi:UDP-N-acetylmuramate dehydrogenase
MLVIQSNASLKTFNTFGIDIKTRYLAEVETAEDIQTLWQLPDFINIPKFVLGSGSNVLFLKDFEGIVIKNNLKGIEKINEDEQHIWLKVASGENWHELVLHCVENNWAGIENLSLIPGTVGAAPIQNIGAYGVEVKETLESLRAFNTTNGLIYTFQNADCELGYRDSIFKNKAKDQYIIVEVVFKLNKNATLKVQYGDVQKTLETAEITNPTIKDISDAVIKIRQSKLPDPKEIGNAGSFFKNPEVNNNLYGFLQKKHPNIPGYTINETTTKIPAAWLIEQCGWKGKRIGNAGVHHRHALVLVNYGNGSGLEIKQLSEKIQESVLEKFGISLQTEVQFVN